MSNPKSGDRHRFIVTAADAGERLDRYLAQQPKLKLSRSRLKQLIELGQVKIVGGQATPKAILRPHQEIIIELPENQPATLEPTLMALDILYEDNDVVAINKPAGLTVHPGAGIKSGTLANALLATIKNLSHLGGPLRPGIVHRLDKDTSGVLLVAKNDVAHAALGRQFAERQISKTYEALVWGQISPALGTIRASIGRHPIARKKMTTKNLRAADSSRKREAITEWRLLEIFQHFSHLKLTPHTGRTHQLRVHLADRGFPIVGDALYGGLTSNKTRKSLTPTILAVIESLNRHFLHASSITFQHPVSEKNYTITAPLPTALTKLLSVIKQDDSKLGGKKG